MGWSNLVVDFHALHSVTNDYINVINSITNFVETTPPTNYIKIKTILTQYSIKNLLNFLGQKGEAAVEKYLKQFHDRRIIKPSKPRVLTYEQRRKSLAYIMFLKLNKY